MLVMGILNVTPDSFADGGLHYDTDLATARRIRLEVHEMPSAAARDVAARNSHESGVG